MRKRAFVPLIVIAAGGILWGIASFTNMFSSDGKPPELTDNNPLKGEDDYQPPPETGFVGSAACADCHADIAESYASHPMALSTVSIAENRWVESEGRAASIPGRRRVLAVTREDDRLVHHEQMFDADGDLIYDQAYPMKYVVGSGQRAKAYLHQVDDLLFMSPLNWYRQSESWDLAPNYRPDDVRRFRRRVKDDCLGCHAGRPVVERRNANRFPEPGFHEMQIGCERCHGPGRKHIEFHERAETLADAADPIINPAKLDPVRRESVCNQCHLSAAARVLRPGRSDLDFRPGMTLSDIWAVLDVGAQITQDGRTRSVNHVQQMRDSRCFTASGGELGCISCHDPHRLPDAGSRLAYYQERCLACHADNGCSLPPPQRQLRDNDCVSCHMPSLPSSNMSHVAQTDHRILRTISVQSGSDSPAATGELKFYAEMEADLPPAERRRALAAGTFIHHLKKGIPYPADLQQNLESALQEFPGDYLLLTILGNLALQRNDLSTARAYLQKACDVSENHEDALDTLMEIAYHMRDWSKVTECAEELIKIDSSDSGAYAMYGDALLQLGRVQEGIRAVERAAELNPDALPLHEWLLQQYDLRGMTESAEEKRELIERIRSAEIPEKLR